MAVKLDVGVDGAASLLVAVGGARPGFERFAVPAVGQPHAEAVIGPSKVRDRLVSVASPHARAVCTAGTSPFRPSAACRTQALPERVSSAAAQEAERSEVVVLGADNAGHATRLRPVAAPAGAGNDRPRAVLGKHNRAEDSTHATVLATAAPPADLDLTTGTADVSAREGNGEDSAALKTIGDQVAALPKIDDQVLRATDAQPAAEVESEEVITADSLTVLLSQVWHLCSRTLFLKHTCARKLLQP